METVQPNCQLNNQPTNPLTSQLFTQPNLPQPTNPNQPVHQSTHQFDPSGRFLLSRRMYHPPRGRFDLQTSESTTIHATDGPSVTRRRRCVCLHVLDEACARTVVPHCGMCMHIRHTPNTRIHSSPQFACARVCVRVRACVQCLACIAHGSCCNARAPPFLFLPHTHTRTHTHAHTHTHTHTHTHLYLTVRVFDHLHRGWRHAHVG